MIKRITVTVLVGILAACSLQAADITDERIKRVENGLIPPVLIAGEPVWNILERMEHYGVPGISIAVIQDFQIVWTKTYGVKDTETGEPVDEQTMFQAASISKTLNATAIMKMVEEGRVSLDEDVNTYLTSWKLPDNEFTAEKKVTVANLLSHTGGTTVHGFPGYEAGAPLPTVQQILSGEEPANTGPVVVNTEPGVMYRYSGGGTTILQLLLTELEGRPYPEIMKEIVLDPLEMTGSSFSQPPTPELQKLVASAHGRDGKPIEGRYHVYPELAAAGLWTTSADLARFAIEHQLSLQSKSNRILSAESEEKMTTPYIGETYGLGFGIEDVKGEVYFSHGGGNWGFNCMLIAHKQKGYGAVVMANSNAMELIGEILRSIAMEYSWAEYISGPYELYSISPDSLKRYTGRFRVGADVVANITVDGGLLNMDMTGERPISLYPISGNEFVRKDYDSRIVFKTAPDPADDKIKLSGGGPERILTRMGHDEKMPFECLASSDIDTGIDGYRKIWDMNKAAWAVTEQRLNRLGYLLMGSGKVKEAIALFALNVEFYPTSANVYDSLGEAYLENGDRELAKENYSKSLELYPGNANAARVLEELGE